jgi:hypothetical protein
VAKRATRQGKAADGGGKSSERLRLIEQELEQHRRDLDLQFRRIAQMQVELDTVKRARGKKKLPRE